MAAAGSQCLNKPKITPDSSPALEFLQRKRLDAFYPRLSSFISRLLPREEPQQHNHRHFILCIIHRALLPTSNPLHRSLRYRPRPSDSPVHGYNRKLIICSIGRPDPVAVAVVAGSSKQQAGHNQTAVAAIERHSTQPKAKASSQYIVPSTNPSPCVRRCRLRSATKPKPRRPVTFLGRLRPTS